MNGQANSVSRAAEFWSNFVQSRVAHTQRISYRDHPHVVAQARQTIDDELAAMHLAMCSLRTHRNTLAPVSDLPSEILARILQFHVIDQPPSKKYVGEDLCGDLGWIRVSHVCRLWRDAALRHPSLWGIVTTELGLSWLELMLNRAKSASLSYSHLDRGKDSERFLTQVLPRLLFRIRSLSISDKISAINIASNLLKSPAHTLHSLTLTSEDGCSNHTTLPEDILENNAPELCRLHLRGINVSWSAPILRGLKHLRLEHDSYHDENSAVVPSFRDFFCAIEGMPNLQTLHLAYILPSRPADRSADDCTAELLHLQSLAFIDDGDKCLDVLKRLHIPPSCRLQLGCAYPLQTRPDDEIHDARVSLRLPEFLPRLCGHFPANMDPFRVVSVFYSDDGYTIGLKLWRTSSVSNSSIFHPPHDPDLFISLCPPFASEYFPEPIEALCDMLPLDNIHVVIFRDCSLSLSDHEWKFLFETNCQQVSSILVGNQSDADGLCEAMRLSDNKAIREKDGQGRASAQAQVFLSDLELLEVESVDFRPYFSSSGEVLEMGQLYVDTFTQRRMIGKPISTIRLGKGCVIDAARLDALKAVIHVEWDPDAIEEIPKAPHGLPEGVVYPDYIMNPEQEE